MKLILNRDEVINKLSLGSFIPYNVIGILENQTSEAYASESMDAVWVRNEYFNYVYGEAKPIQTHLMRLEDDFYGFSGVIDALAQQIYTEHLLHWYEPTNRYVLSDLPQVERCPYEVVSLGMEEAEGIDERYEYRQEGSLKRIRDAIANRPTSAIYQAGELASYVLVHEDNSIGYMYTKPEYRELGLGYWVTIDILKKMKSRGKVPFVEINQRNFKSQGLAKKTHLEKDALTPWFGIIKGKPKWFDEWNPLNGRSFMFTTLVHLRRVNGLSTCIETLHLEKENEHYVGRIEEKDQYAHFELILDPSQEAYCLKCHELKQMSLLELLAALSVHFPEENTSLVMENTPELIGKIGLCQVIKG